MPNRSEFVFTPTHGSWPNLIESFFGKITKTLLQGLQVATKEGLKIHIEMYLPKVNENFMVFQWRYKLKTLSVV